MRRHTFPLYTLFALLLVAEPLLAQLTVTRVAIADNGGQATEPLQGLDPAAISGGNFAHRADLREGSSYRISIRLNGSTAVRGAGPGVSPGDSAPGTSSTFSSFMPEVFVNAGGQVAFTGVANDSNVFGFWAGLPGSLQLVARDGSPAPGTSGAFSIGYPGNNFGSLRAFNDAGQVAFSAGIAGAPNTSSSGLWMGAPGALQLVARTGSQAPGFADGVTWSSLGDIQLNDAGQVAFFAYISQEPPLQTGVVDRGAIMVGTPGALQVVARSGQPAPGLESEVYLRLNSDAFSLSASGQVAFRAGAESGSLGVVPRSEVIYAGGPGALQLVARTNQPAPGTEDGAVFKGFDKPVVNAAGEVAFTSFVGSAARPSGKGIWVGKPGRLRLIARTGDPAPVVGGQVFSDFNQDALLLSDSGQVAFLANYEPSSGGSAGRAIFATDKTGVLRMVARVGASINGGPILTGLQLASNPTLAGSGDGRRTSLDADGRLVFYADSADANSSYKENIFLATFDESAPVILAEGQPRNVGAVLGGSVTFDVSALNSQKATFQWRFNGADITGATDPILTLTEVTTANRGAYTVVVTNAQGSIESAPAQLSFPPAITQGPLDQHVNAGDNLSLQVATAGPGPLTYQWQYKAAGASAFTNLQGGAQATLSIANITIAQAGRYRVIVTNSDGSETSSEAVVTIAATGAPLVERVFIAGDPVPGISDNLFFAKAEDAVLNNEGEIVFESYLLNNDGSMGTYFRSADGQYRFISYQTFNANLSDSGELAQVNSRPSTTIELGTPGNMQPLARRDTVAPDGAGSYYLDGSYALDANGTAAFRFDTHLGTAAFIGKPGAVSLLGVTNAAAPGLPNGVKFDYVLEPVINPAGTAAFFATLKGTGITADNDTSIWTGTAAGVQRVVAEDALVPAAGNGVRVGDIRFPDTGTSPFGWNAAGQLAFQTTLAGTGVTAANDKAILAGTPDALQVVAREGVANGHTFDLSQGAYPIINRTGQVAFVAMVTPTGSSNVLESLWLWTPGAGGGTRKLIAREGQQAPGLPAGVVFDSAEIGRPLLSCSINGAGQLVLMTRLAGPGISFDASNDLAVYLTTPTGELKLVARTGSPIEVGGGEKRDLRFLYFPLRSGGEDGRPRSLNESGNLVMTAELKKAGTLASDYGLFLAHLPGTGAIAPSVTTLDPTTITSTGATLRANVNPNNEATSVHFEYGATTAYGQSTPAQNVSAGNVSVPVSAAISGLTPNTTYHVRVVATNSVGTANGSDLTFKTTGNTGGGGGTGDFTLNVTGLNPGAVVSPADAFRVTATPQLPRGSKTKVVSVQFFVDDEAIAPPDTKSKFTADAKVTEPGPHALTAIATDAEGKAVESSPIAFTVTEAGAGPIALQSSISPNDGTAAPGELITYTLTATNSSNTGVKNVELALQVPVGAGYVDTRFVDANGQPITPPKGSDISFNGANGTVTVTLKEVKAFAGFTLQLLARVPYDQTATGIVIASSSFKIAAAQVKEKFSGTFPTRSVTVEGSLPPNAPRPRLGLFVKQSGAGELPQDKSVVTVTTAALGVPDVKPKRLSNEITYQVTFINYGNAPAHSVRVIVPVPPGTTYKKKSAGVLTAAGDSIPVTEVEFGNLLFFDVPRLEPNFPSATGSAKTLEYTVRVDKKAAVGTRITHLGAAVSSGELLTPVNTLIEKVAQVVAPAQMTYDFTRQYVKGANEPVDSSGGTVVHTIFFHNQGGLTAKEVGIRYTVPPGLAFQSASFANSLGASVPVKRGQSVTGPATGASSGNVDFTIGTVKPGDFGFAQVVLKFDANTRPAADNISQATFTGYDNSTTGLHPARALRDPAAKLLGQQPSLVGTIRQPHLDATLSRLFILQAAPAAVTEGGEFDLLLVWGNLSDTSSGSGAFTFSVPEGTELVSASTATPGFGGASIAASINPAGTAGAPNGRVVWTLGPAPHSILTATVRLRAKLGVTGEIRSTGLHAGFDLSVQLYGPPVTVRLLPPGVPLEASQSEIYNSVIGQGSGASVGTASTPAGRFIEQVKQITESSRVLGIAGADYAHIAGNDGVAIPLGGGRMVAAGGLNLVPQSSASMVAAGGMNMVAAGGGNMQVEVPGSGFLTSTQLISNAPSLVAAGGLNMVAAGGMNLLRKTSGLVGNDGASLIGLDGSTLVGLDGATLGTFSQRLGAVASFQPNGAAPMTLSANAASMVAAGGGNLRIAGGGHMVAAGGGNLIPPAGLVGNDGASLVGNDGSTLVGNDGASLIGNDGSTLIGNDGSTMVAAGGGNFITGTTGMVAAGGGN